jgi:hypothetical protein
MAWLRARRSRRVSPAFPYRQPWLSVTHSPSSPLPLPHILPRGEKWHTGLLLRACGDDDDVAAPGLGVRAGAHAHAGGARVRGVGEVERLAVAAALVGVDEEDAPGDGAQDEGVGDGAADGAGADDGDGG